MANDCLDELLRGFRAHRAEGCHDWFCMDGEMKEHLESFGFGAVHVMFRAAIDRILVAAENGPD